MDGAVAVVGVGVGVVVAAPVVVVVVVVVVNAAKVEFLQLEALADFDVVVVEVQGGGSVDGTVLLVVRSTMRPVVGYVVGSFLVVVVVVLLVAVVGAALALAVVVVVVVVVLLVAAAAAVRQGSFCTVPRSKHVGQHVSSLLFSIRQVASCTVQNLVRPFLCSNVSSIGRRRRHHRSSTSATWTQ